MLLRQFPDLNWLKTQAQARFADRKAIDGRTLPNSGWPTVMLQAKTNMAVRDQIPGPLSIFTNRFGNSTIAVKGKRVDVSPDTYFISNQGEAYTLEIQKTEPTETFNLHFGDHFVKNALGAMLESPSNLLESKNPEMHFGFFNRLEPVTPVVRELMEKISTTSDGLEQDEKLYQLLQVLVQSQVELNKRRDRVSGIKKSTKEEILKKLIDATDYLYAYYTLSPTLDELAMISGISKFHFLRLFKMAYGVTPHQFIIDLRMKQSVNLLRTTNLTVNQVAAKVGFDDSSSYSRAFHKSQGVYPSRFRR